MDRTREARRMESRRSRGSGSLLVGVALGLLLGAFVFTAHPAFAAKGKSQVYGGGWAGMIKEAVFGFTENKGPLQAIQVERGLVKVPKEYGEPFAVTVEGNDTMVWYRSNELGVRNVRMSGAQDLMHLLPVDPVTKKSEEVSTSGR